MTIDELRGLEATGDRAYDIIKGLGVCICYDDEGSPDWDSCDGCPFEHMTHGGAVSQDPFECLLLAIQRDPSIADRLSAIQL